ncbi:hydrolase TatD [Chryseobacterium sp. Leaf180]|jgi:TatD DNase family protein|uniref:TatD family hydrolase n=1 Tax=Chryseobacterium sp. Leaf180 TaxID=1736289 RepID=UPI0006F92F7B|nr:TatD family hydrolase [Chryseobacterium sp. Leaf180]KQR95096.1 hydrolase TatD [Chryseobacterium sp. Leaf180]
MSFFDFHHHHPDLSFGIYNLPLLENLPETTFSAGIHPKDISEENLDQHFDWLDSVASHKNCFAIGECGLDQNISVSLNLQNDIFKRQINLSNDLKKPIIVHCVKKFYEVITMKKFADRPMIIHGFNKNRKVADDLLAHNFYLSFGKAALYNLSLQETLKNTPLEKMFLETDGKDFDITDLYVKTAELKNIPMEKLLSQISENLHTIQYG